MAAPVGSLSHRKTFEGGTCCKVLGELRDGGLSGTIYLLIVDANSQLVHASAQSQFISSLLHVMLLFKIVWAILSIFWSESEKFIKTKVVNLNTCSRQILMKDAGNSLISDSNRIPLVY